MLRSHVFGVVSLSALALAGGGCKDSKARDAGINDAGSTFMEPDSALAGDAEVVASVDADILTMADARRLPVGGEGDALKDAGVLVELDTAGTSVIDSALASNQDAAPQRDNNTVAYAEEDLDVDVGSNPEIAVDHAGFVHITYYGLADGTVKYATNKSGQWVVTSLNKVLTTTNISGVGGSPSIAVTAEGVVHISFMEGDYLVGTTVGSSGIKMVAKHITNQSGTWVTEQIGYTNYFGVHTSIAIGPNSKVYVAYPMVTCTTPSTPGLTGENRQDGILVATNESGSWSSYYTYRGGTANVVSGSCIDFDLEFDVSIAVGPDNRAHVAHSGTSSSWMQYSSYLSQTYNTEVIEETAKVYGAHYPSIGVDPTGKVFISFKNTSGTQLRLAQGSRGAWTISGLNDTSTLSSVAIDKLGNAYVLAVDNGIEVYSNRTGTFSVDLRVPTSYSSLGVSARALAFDSNNRPHIVYRGVPGNKLVYAHEK